MELTNKQKEGLDIIVKRYRANAKYTVISGYAGTGKSTLVKFAIEALDVEENKVAYACYTGKAAEVLRKKGNKNAMTLHKLLYDSVPRPGGGFFRRKKTCLDYTVVVVDEVSMVPKSMIDILLSHKIYILFLGDPFQLPQIDKNESHTLLDNPDIFLDEIMRQAAESEIIRLSRDIRLGNPIKYMKGSEVIVVPYRDINTSYLTWADQVICGTNKRRIDLNNQMRELAGFTGPLPQNGEKMICLRNYWDDLSIDGSAALVNGMTGIIKNPFENFVMIPQYIKMIGNHKLESITCSFVSEDGNEFNSVSMDKHMLLTGEKCIEWRDSYTLGRMINKIGDIIPREFTYGYAITCHKSQGSEWDNVLVMEESFPFDKTEHARWLYTAVTRSAEKCVLVR